MALRIKDLPTRMIRVPVLYVPEALKAFERAVDQVPEYGSEVVAGYVAALIYWNRPETWKVLKDLKARGIIWMEEATDAR